MPGSPRRREALRRACLPFAILLATSLAACGDDGPTDPGGWTASRLQLAELPPGDTVHGRGIEFLLRFPRSGSGLQLLTVVVDRGSPAERIDTLPGHVYWHAWPAAGDTSTLETRVTTHAGTGKHSFVIRAFLDGGRTVESPAFTRVFRVDDVAYRVTRLVGPSGEAASAYDLNDRDEVVGEMRTGSQVNALLWRGGVATRIAVDGAPNPSARAINEAGQILAWTNASGATNTALLTPGLPPLLVGGVGRALNDRGIALIGTANSSLQILNSSTGALTGVCVAAYMESCANGVLGAAGQVSFTRHRIEARTYTRESWGEVPYTMPPHRALYGHGWGGTRAWISALGDAGEALVQFENEQLGISLPGQGAHNIDQLLGGTASVMSRRGGLVVALSGSLVDLPAAGADSALYLWRVRDRRTHRVAGEASGWLFEALRGVNANGSIIAQGRHRTTGERAALLLTPTP